MQVNTSSATPSKTTVSVIIPVYNAEKWLAQCLESVCAQTLPGLEILCVNDGSQDGSLTILQKYAETDGRIRIFNRPNKGAANARNYAIQKAHGEFVAFLDADDYYPTCDALQHLYQGAKDHGVAACAGLRLLDFSGEIRQHPLHREAIAQFPQGTVIRYADFQQDYHYHGYIYSKSLIDRYQIKFPNLTRYEDPVFFADFMIQAQQFYVVPHEVYCYRKKDVDPPLSAQQTIDAITGITMNLRSSSAAGLARLHWVCIHRLNSEYREDILRNARSSAREQICQGLQKADASQNYSLIQTIHKEYASGTHLKVLEEVLRNTKPTAEQNILVRGIKCIRENGIPYTVKHLAGKILTKFRF